MTETSSFATWFKSRRKQLGYTQEELAARVSCSFETIRRIENGSRKPSEQLAELLAQGLQVPPEERETLVRWARMQPAEEQAPAAGYPNNLPHQVTRFIGREKEIAAIYTLLLREDVPLVTLTGAGGSGKTRLALQVAGHLLDRFPHGVFFVNLAPITDPDSVASTIAQALGVPERPGEPVAVSLKSLLREKQMLLLIDNFEQVVTAAPLLSDLLASAPDLKMLVTSRETLRLAGEHLFQVLPLSLPDPSHLPPLEILGAYEAVRLFVDRAQAHRPDFHLTEHNARDIVEICARLDGLPLAIELAAARVKILAPHALLTRLSHRLDLLTGGPRDLAARQQTLRAAIDWSYDLLGDPEKQLFRRMAVFRGGRTLQALEAVCNSEALQIEGQLQLDVLDGVQSLIDSSLLEQREGRNGEPRFWMLETIHEYAGEKLRESGEEEKVKHQHLAYYMSLAERASQQIEGPDQETWMQQLGTELANYRAALTWALENEPSLGLHLVLGLARYWYLVGYLAEGRRWLERSLAHNPEAQPPERAMALNNIGTFAWGQGYYEEATSLHSESLLLAEECGDKRIMAEALLGIGAARRWAGQFKEAVTPLTESLVLYRELGDNHGVAHTLNRLGLVASDHGNLQQAALLLEESITISRQVGTKSLLAASLNNLGSVFRTQGDLAKAVPLFEESLLLLRSTNVRLGIVQPLVNLAVIALRQGDHAKAAPLLQEGLRLSWEVGRKGVVAWCLFGLAKLAAVKRQYKKAARLYGALHVLDEPVPSALQVEFNQDVASARHGLGEAEWVSAWNEGKTMSLGQTIAYALEDLDEPEPGATTSHWGPEGHL